MTTSDVLAVVAATVVTMLVAVLAAVLVALARTLRDLRRTIADFEAEAVPLLDDARRALHDTGTEIDRVERIVTNAERLSDAVDGASKLAARAIASPVVKAMAFGTGVSRAAQRLRDGEQAEAARANGRRSRRKRRAS
jgi:Bacterial protein of unknown function (DUF948)